MELNMTFALMVLTKSQMSIDLAGIKSLNTEMANNIRSKLRT